MPNRRLIVPILAAALSMGGCPTDPVERRWPGIEHVVIIIKENRTFDNLFGRFPGANGVTVGMYHGEEVPLARGTYRIPTDLPHNWPDAFKHRNGGKMDGFGNTPEQVRHAYTQFHQDQIPNYWHWAEEFVLSDNFFASHLGPSFPNHMFTISAQSGGARSTPVRGRPPPGRAVSWGCDAPQREYVVIVNEDGETVRVPPCFDFKTAGDLLTDAGVDWRYYAATATQNGYIWSIYNAIRHIRETDQWEEHIFAVDDFVDDALADRLPAVTWVTPLFAFSDHPKFNTSLCHGENWSTQIVNAIMQSPMWPKTAIFMTWDDWGGYYDHVPPPMVDEEGFGFRVPLLTISPYAKRGYIDSQVGEFSSMLRFIEDQFDLPQLTDRDAAADNLSYNFDFTQPPRPPDPLRLRQCPGPPPHLGPTGG